MNKEGGQITNIRNTNRNNNMYSTEYQYISTIITNTYPKEE